MKTFLGICNISNLQVQKVLEEQKPFFFNLLTLYKSAAENDSEKFIKILAKISRNESFENYLSLVIKGQLINNHYRLISTILKCTKLAEYKNDMDNLEINPDLVQKLEGVVKEYHKLIDCGEIPKSGRTSKSEKNKYDPRKQILDFVTNNTDAPEKIQSLINDSTNLKKIVAILDNNTGTDGEKALADHVRTFVDKHLPADPQITQDDLTIGLSRIIKSRDHVLNNLLRYVKATPEGMNEFKDQDNLNAIKITVTNLDLFPNEFDSNPDAYDQLKLLGFGMAE